MCELSLKMQIFLGEHAEQISDNTAVVLACGRADIQNTLDIQKHCDNRRFCRDADIQHRAGCAGIRGGKGLSRSRLGEDIAVAPDILLYYQNAPRQHETYRLRRISGA